MPVASNQSQKGQLLRLPPQFPAICNFADPMGPPLALIDPVGMGQRRTKPLIS